jgi:hypothetical protein
MAKFINLIILNMAVFDSTSHEQAHDLHIIINKQKIMRIKIYEILINHFIFCIITLPGQKYSTTLKNEKLKKLRFY